MNRLLLFLFMIFVPVIFSWWLFIPIALLSVYLVGVPYEAIVAALLLDSLYYFGEGFWRQHPLLIFALVSVAAALFLSRKIYWRKII